MRDLQLKSRRFREEREQDWIRLEELLRRAEGGGSAPRRKTGARREAGFATSRFDRLMGWVIDRRPAQLSVDEIVSLTVLYRSALSSLSVARATSLDHNLVDYLESLCSRAYFFVYGTRTNFVERVARFFREDWPRAAQALWRETLLAAALGILGCVVAYLLVSQDPDWYYSLMSGMAQGRDPSATTESLRATLYADGKDGTKEGLSSFATYLFTHNAQVSLFCFALGFMFGVPTALLLLQNGAMLGAMLALFASRGLGVELMGWLLIHGVTELLAITVAGAAGFRIGWAVAFPGERTRVEAAGAAGRQAATLMCGVVVMLFVAGLLEGFGRQLIQQDWLRYAIAGTTGALWFVYLYGPRRAPG
jgi:uncharacterized membrane protein SpoIIM required for sporulation